MRDAGQKFRQVRERQGLRYRDVEDASQWIANQHGNHDFLVGLSRLADIENKGTTPSLYRLYSLCAIYRVDLNTALGWYGVSVDQLPNDAAHFGAQQTQTFDLDPAEHAPVSLPAELLSDPDLRETIHLNRSVRSWGKLPISLLNSLEMRKHRYAFIGTDDWSMYPIIPPGSFLQLDERKKKIVLSGWSTEHERPIYFIEHRNGFKCGWCSQAKGQLILQSHPSSGEPPVIFQIPDQVDVIGQVIGVVMRLDLARKRHTHS